MVMYCEYLLCVTIILLRNVIWFYESLSHSITRLLYVESLNFLLFFFFVCNVHSFHFALMFVDPSHYLYIYPCFTSCMHAPPSPLSLRHTFFFLFFFRFVGRCDFKCPRTRWTCTTQQTITLSAPAMRLCLSAWLRLRYNLVDGRNMRRSSHRSQAGHLSTSKTFLRLFWSVLQDILATTRPRTSPPRWRRLHHHRRRRRRHRHPPLLPLRCWVLKASWMVLRKEVKLLASLRHLWCLLAV